MEKSPFLRKMDIWSHPVNDIKSLHGLCMDNQESDDGCVGDLSVDELAYGATKFLNIEDGVEGVLDSILPPHEKCVLVLQKKDEPGEAHQIKIITEAHENDDTHVITSENITDDNAKSVHPHCSHAPSLHKTSKPVSAMKGSREKCGLTPSKKLTVKWAPDVYDPVPASSLRIVISRPRKQGKKRSKSKQKNTSKSLRGRGNKGTDKKQVHKNTSSKLYEHKEDVIHVPEIHQPSGMDFHLGIPEHSCGGSFVNTYGSSLHVSSITQAT